MARNIRMTWDPAASFLAPGAWANLTPPGVLPMAAPTSYGSSSVSVAPSNNDIVFATFDQRGLYKSTNRGRTWAKKGPFESPLKIEIDSNDANHLYLTQGVRDATQGFFVSTNGGDTWARPAGFDAVCATVGLGYDVTWLDVDTSDFSHLLIGCHSPWTNIGSGTNAGILESRDGGATFTYSLPDSTWPVGTPGVNLLRDAATSKGGADTWLVTTETAGAWRTANRGVSYTKVSDNNGVHGGQDLCYAPDGSVLTGGYQYPMRSTDNGLTWTQLTSLPFNFYFGVWRIGSALYTCPSNVGGGGACFYRSLDSGVTWAPFIPGELFNAGPYDMTYAPTTGILYSASLFTGLIATQL